MITTVSHATYESPLGRMKVEATEKGVLSIGFTHDDQIRFPRVPNHLSECLHQLDEYFYGDRKHFELVLAMQGSAFQLDVWNAILDLPFGETATYGEVAGYLGNKGASRAVGHALHVNPLLIIIPCHRIVPSFGGAGEYSAGIPRKDWLLRHEWDRKEKDPEDLE